MSVWLSYWQIGEDKTDLTSMGTMKTSFSVNHEEVKKQSRDVQGNLKKISLDKTVDTIRVNCSNMTQQVCDQLEYVLLNARAMIYLKAFDAGRTDKQNRVSTSLTTVKMVKTSRRFISISSVVLASAPSGTNYFTGGSYDEDTYILNLGTSLPAGGGANQEVIVTYTYKGWKGAVTVDNITMATRKEAEVFNLSFSMEGI